MSRSLDCRDAGDQDDGVKLALLRKLEPGIRERHAEPLEQIEAYSRPALNRDVSGYKIPPHPDTKAKVMSGLIYFPKSDAQRRLGTSLYVPTRSFLRKKPGFRRVKTVPFQANCGLVFAVTNRSLHGHERLPRRTRTSSAAASTTRSSIRACSR